jgi:hypothetical protein
MANQYKYTVTGYRQYGGKSMILHFKKEVQDNKVKLMLGRNNEWTVGEFNLMTGNFELKPYQMEKFGNSVEQTESTFSIKFNQTGVTAVFFKKRVDLPF